MTQDQYSQAREPGYVVRDDVVPEDENEEVTDQSKPMTRFQKVASALRGDRADQDEADQDQPTANQVTTSSEAAAGSGVMAQNPDASGASRPWVTERDEAAMTNSPISRERDYWDAPGATGAKRDATEPDVFGTTALGGNGATSTPYAEGQPPGATIADVPAGSAPATDVSPVGEMRPGDPTALGDFSDLTYGNLIPDAKQFTAQWQQIQFRFVDDPQGSVTEAADVVAQVTAKMEAAIQERQRAIEERQRAIQEQQRSLRGRWGEGANADTEVLRETLRMYKTFLDQLIGPGPAS
jgi:hypothetical protein